MGYDFDERAVPTVDLEKCTDCGACAGICPTETLALENGKLRIAERTFMGCIGCGHCMMVCPTGGITVTGRRLAPEDLVELPPREQRATAEQFEALLLARRSVRQFTERPIERQLVERILNIVATAPIGIPPSEVGVVFFDGQEKVRQFAEDAVACFRSILRFFHPVVLTVMRPFIGKAQHALLRDFVRPLLQLIVKEWAQGKDGFTYNAPAAMLFHHGPDAGPEDDHIAATYAMLAAESFGLGSCMIGTTVALDHDRNFKAKYGIPAHNKITLGLVMGYPKVEFRRTVRRKLGLVGIVGESG